MNHSASSGGKDCCLANNVVNGPAIIEEATATTVIENNQVCTVDQNGNLIITLNKRLPMKIESDYSGGYS